MNWDIENQVKNEGYSIICGCDEAGRGPLAGPVFAAAVILPHGIEISGLNDSKKLTEKQRDKLFDEIISLAVDYAIASASVEEIEEINILNASMLAMKRAIESLKTKPEYALIDGNISRGFSIPATPVVHGDAISPSIAAASILAKVTRDRLCLELDAEYPMYGIAKHKGYGTKEHMKALFEYGPAPIHRTKFIRFLDGEKK